MSLRSSICWFGKNLPHLNESCNNCYPDDGVCNHNAIDREATTKPSCCHIDLFVHMSVHVVVAVRIKWKFNIVCHGKCSQGPVPIVFCWMCLTFTKRNNLSKNVGKHCHDSKRKQHIVLNLLLQCANACPFLTDHKCLLGFHCGT